jgi:hypothetical protein
MPAHYSATDPIQPTGSIVERAVAVLEAQRNARDPASSAAGVPETPDAALEVLQKRVEHLREQAQDLLDQFARAAERLPSSVPLAPSAPGPAGLNSSLHALDGASVPVLRTATASPGTVGRGALGLVNETHAPATVVLRATSLVSELGDEISGDQVTFAPNPLNLPPGGELPVLANVRVPPGVRPGKYSGLVQAVGLAATRAVMTLIVIPTERE